MINASVYWLIKAWNKASETKFFFVGFTSNHFLDGDFFVLVFFDFAAALGLALLFFLAPNAAPQLSEYFLVVPLRKMVMGRS